jgi:glycosyltransferase involved in cell wall biosynthesis
VLLTTPFLGGAGGIERYTFAAADALASAGVEVVVVYGRDKGGSWGQLHEDIQSIDMASLKRLLRTGVRGRLHRRKRSSRRALDSIRRGFDVHLALGKNPAVTRLIDASFRIINASGKSLSAKTASLYDCVALEAPGNTTLIAPGVSTCLLAPPVQGLPQPVAPAVQLPSDFLLTVFNPYASVKGVAELIRILDMLPLPLAWCHSQSTLTFDIPDLLQNHRNIVHITDASPSELRWLYENCFAYISFSLQEGFGWSVADAVRYSRRVFSRQTGVASFPEVDSAEGVVIYQDAESLPVLIPQTPPSPVPRPLERFAPAVFVDALMRAPTRQAGAQSSRAGREAGHSAIDETA